MPTAWPYLLLAVITVAFCILVWQLIGLARRIRTTLEHAEKTLATTSRVLEELDERLIPVLNRLKDLEETTQGTLEDVRSRLNVLDTELVPLIREVKQTAGSYRHLEQAVEDWMEKEVTPLLREATEAAGGLKDVTRDVKTRVDQTRELFNAIGETGKTLRIATGIMRAGLTGLAVQVASIATGMKTSLEYLSENLITKGGGKDELQ